MYTTTHTTTHNHTLQVDLYENGTIAIVEAVSPELGNRVQRVRVQLPGTSSELLAKFREKNVDFAAHTNTEDGGAVFLNLLGMCDWIASCVSDRTGVLRGMLMGVLMGIENACCAVFPAAMLHQGWY